MQRTVKTIQMNVVTIENGDAVVKSATFATNHRKEVERICRKKGLLPMWDSAKRFDNLYIVDDDEFFKIAKLEKSVEVDAKEIEEEFQDEF